MNILIPIIAFGKEGGYRVLSELANNWLDTGHKVSFIVTEFSIPPYYPTSAEIIWIDKSGKRTFSPKLNNDEVQIRFSGLIYALYLGLNKYGKDFDIILANHSLSTWPVNFSRIPSHKKFYYIQAFEPDYLKSLTDFKNKILYYASVLSYHFRLYQITNSPMFFDYKSVKAKTFVPPGVNFTLFYPNKGNIIKSGRSVKLGCIGRKEPQKGTIYVLKALELLLKQGINVELHIAFGNLPENYNHEQVTVVLPANDKELGDYYRSVDIMIAPGLIELQGAHYPVLEALACGIPLITTGYMPANDQNAWIVPIKDENAIAEKVIEIIKKPELAERKREQGLIDIKPFGWASVANKMLQLFKKNENLVY